MAGTTLTPQDDDAAPLRTFPELTEKEEGFVYAMLANGGKQTAAARTAGYAKSSAHVTASRLMRKPAVIRALAHATTQAIGGMLPAALTTVSKLGLKAKSEHIRLKASQDLLDRAGVTAPKKVAVAGAISVNIDLG